MPTEAEWEYACRAGTTTAYYFGDQASVTQANFKGGYPNDPWPGRTTKVGSYQPNAFGLYDMHGNVRQWCQDFYDPNYYKNSPVPDPPGPQRGDNRRVVRSGSFNEGGQFCRSAHRGSANTAYSDIGFRVVAMQSSKPSAEGAQSLANSIGMKLVLIPPGKFLMGSLPDGQKRRTNEEQHEVVITKPFYLGMYPVTQAEYSRVTGNSPSGFSATGRFRNVVRGLDTSRFPVETISWAEAVDFCRQSVRPARREAGGTPLPLADGSGMEYACRAGTTTAYYCGDSLSTEQANVGHKLGRTTPVGSYPPNAFGFFDMHGNVWSGARIGTHPNRREEKIPWWPRGPCSGSAAAAAGTTRTPGTAARPAASASSPIVAGKPTASAWPQFSPGAERAGGVSVCK